MRTEYQEWIDVHYPSQKEAYGQCRQAVEKMKAQFPELLIKCGFAETDIGQRTHFWCETLSGDIVDPTKRQFLWVFEYEALPPDHPARLYPPRKCMNCGVEKYQEFWSGACSDKCGKELEEFLNGGAGGLF